MKKLTLLLIAIAFVTMTHAQLFSIGKMNFGYMYVGPKLGGNVATSSYDDGLGNESIMNFGQQFGLVARVGITEKLSIQPELVYTSKGFASQDPTFTTNNNYNYIGLPIVAKYAFLAFSGVQIYGSGGFYTDVLTSVNVVLRDSIGNENQYEEILDVYNRVDFGLNFGGGANFKLNSGDRLNVDLAFTYGFVNTDNSGFSTSSKNVTIQLSAIYLFDLTRFLKPKNNDSGNDLAYYKRNYNR